MVLDPRWLFPKSEVATAKIHTLSSPRQSSQSTGQTIDVCVPSPLRRAINGMKAYIPHPRGLREILCAPAEGLSKRSGNLFVGDATRHVGAQGLPVLPKTGYRIREDTDDTEGT